MEVGSPMAHFAALCPNFGAWLASVPLKMGKALHQRRHQACLGRVLVQCRRSTAICVVSLCVSCICEEFFGHTVLTDVRR